MQINNFIGIDVSKLTLDFSLVKDGKQILHEKVPNESKSIMRTIRKFIQQGEGTYEDTVFCMEHTGIYNSKLVKCLHQFNALIWIESGVQIKLSQGATRGKNDKVDSLRIALYAYVNKHKIKLWKPRREVVSKLSDLLALRTRLIKAKNSLEVPLKEHKSFSDKSTYNLLKKNSMPAVNSLVKQIEKTEAEIKSIIKEDEALKQLFQNICSVDGVGMITAVHIIVSTNEFIWINDPRKFACYSGVVPFQHSSGTSIRGKNRVSHRANKTIKCILHLSAMSAVSKKGELQNYYKRKVAEGKNKMSALNAVRNKIIHRVFACVRDNRAYEKIFIKSVA
jgi:transposase